MRGRSAGDKACFRGASIAPHLWERFVAASSLTLIPRIGIDIDIDIRHCLCEALPAPSTHDTVRFRCPRCGRHFTLLRWERISCPPAHPQPRFSGLPRHVQLALPHRSPFPDPQYRRSRVFRYPPTLHPIPLPSLPAEDIRHIDVGGFIHRR